MYRGKYKNKFVRMAACCLMAVLVLSNVYVPRTFAAENYFTVEGGTLALDEVEPDQRSIWVTLKAAREMTIHYLEGYFTPVDNDEELEYGFGDISAIFPGMGGNRCSLSSGWFYWSAEEFMDSSISSEGIHVQAGDSIFQVTYDVKAGVEMMKRNMPVSIELAVIDDGAETGKQIENITMDAYARAGHTLSVRKYVSGNGDLDIPDVVIGGTDLDVRIIPEPGNELVSLELNDRNIIDQVEDNVYRVTAGTESLDFEANFHRVYQVLEGDGGEHIKGSEETLSFKVDNDVTEFCGRGLLIIDDEYLDMRYECMVDPENQTIILQASSLNALELGEHSFEAFFSEPDSGSARASFRVIEDDSDEDEDGDGNDDGDEDGDDGEREEDDETGDDDETDKDSESSEDEEGDGEEEAKDEGKEDDGEEDGNKEDEAEDEEENGTEDETIPTPNTGMFTGDGGSVELEDGIMYYVAFIVLTLAAARFITKKVVRG